MSQQIDFFFTTVSPWTYLGMPRLRRIAQQHSARIRYLPINLSEIFHSVEVKPLAQRPKPLQENRLQELVRWREFLQMPLNLHPKHFPTNPEPSCRLLIAHIEQGGDAGALAEAIMRACWVEDRDISDPLTLEAIAVEHALDGERLLQRSGSDATARTFAANTREALQRGVIGSPCYLLGDQLFFGQDRLDFVERALENG